MQIWKDIEGYKGHYQISNYIPRNMLFGYELSEKEKKDFDYLDDIDMENFIHYKGMIFHIGDFMRLSDDSEEKKAGWDGYYGLNAFCAVVIKIVDCDKVIMGRVLC